MAQDFEAAKAFLKISNDDGSTLYDHLTNVLLKIVQEKPENALQAFENLSCQVKASKFVGKDLKEISSSPMEPDTKRKLLSSLSKTQSLIAKRNVDDDDEGDDDDQFAIPDLMGHAEMFEWAGISLGKLEVYKIMRSLTLLAEKEELKSVRLFGKVFGTQADYIICEASKDMDDDDISDDSKVEPSGEGANEFVYFVTNSPEGKWTQLPNVTPEQIVTARQMRRFFTGDLNAPVLGFPRFPWGEAAYLRAQITRIAHSTTISPRGFYIQDEDVDEDAKIENDEFEPLLPSELMSAENWTHHRNHLLKQARCTKYEEPEKDDDDDDMDDDVQDDEEEEEDEPMPFLSTLETDEDPKLQSGGGPAELWSFRSCSSGVSSHALACVQSLNWPGAVAVCKGKSFANIYVGYGHKHLPTNYTPPPPPAVQNEYVSTWDPEEDDGPDPMKEQADPLPPAEGGDDGDEEADEDEDEYYDE